MQNTIDTCGDGLPDYPEDVQVADVNVYIHPVGFMATHDYSCPICREKHAVLNMTDGIMKPCWDCQKKGYQTIKIEKSWWTRILFNMLTGKELR
jgi:hypothetical protein